MPYEPPEPRLQPNTVSSKQSSPSLGVLSYYSMLAQERERRQIATHVHDNIVKDLVFCNLRLGLAQRSDSTAELAAALEETQCLVRLVIEKIRMSIAEISPPLLYDIGLEESVRELLEELKNRFNINYYFEGDGAAAGLATDEKVLLYVSIRELLENVISHAGARNVWVSIQCAGHNLEVAIEDDGSGFDAAAVISSQKPGSGVGLMNLRERLKYKGGWLDIQSRPEEGTRVTLAIPCPATIP